MKRLIASWLGFSATFLAVVSTATAEVDFAHQIVPILRKHCAECHAGEEKKGGFSLNTRAELLEGSENGEVVKIGKPDESHLVYVVETEDPEFLMPPKGDRISASEIALLRKWIETGLAWEPGFAFGETNLRTTA